MMLFQVQILGYNADLYENFTSASAGPNGLVGIAVLIEVGFSYEISKE